MGTPEHRRAPQAGTERLAPRGAVRRGTLPVRLRAVPGRRVLVSPPAPGVRQGSRADGPGDCFREIGQEHSPRSQRARNTYRLGRPASAARQGAEEVLLDGGAGYTSPAVRADTWLRNALRPRGPPDPGEGSGGGRGVRSPRAAYRRRTVVQGAGRPAP